MENIKKATAEMASKIEELKARYERLMDKSRRAWELSWESAFNGNEEEERHFVAASEHYAAEAEELERLIINYARLEYLVNSKLGE